MERLFLTTELPAPGDGFHHGAAAILRADGRALLVHRASGRDWAPDTWDVPGGHVEGIETETDAVRREVREELGIVVEIRAASADSRLRGPNFDVAYFIFDSWVGTPVNAAPEEHVAIGWFTAAEVAELTLADAHLLPIVLDALR